MLKIEYRDHICKATIQRRAAHNAINFAIMEQWENLLDELENNNAVRCFILTGEGDKTFISGGDLKEFHTLKTAEEAVSMAERMHVILNRLENLCCWTIAGINGDVYGGGWEVMLAFDFTIMVRSARIGFTQGKFYLPPGWNGLTRLVERVGRSTALQWLAESAVIEKETILTNRLVNYSVSTENFENETWKWAEKLSYNDRKYIHALKKGALRALKARRQAMTDEIKPFAHFWEDEQHRERVEKFINK